MAGGACQSGTESVPFGITQVSSALLVPESPHVGATSQCLATPVTTQHRAGWHEDDGPVGACRSHQQRRCGLVATAHQDRPVERVGAEYLLGLHRQEVPVQHRCRLLEGLRERGHGKLERITARLPDTALYRLGTFSQVHMTGIDVAPGVEDPDHRLAGMLLGSDTELPGARAVAESPQSVTVEPAAAVKLVRFADHGSRSQSSSRLATWIRIAAGNDELGGLVSRAHIPSWQSASFTTETL